MPAVPTGIPCAAASSGQASPVVSEQSAAFRVVSSDSDGEREPRGMASNGSHLSAVTFREMMIHLADEYEYMQDALTRLLDVPCVDIPEEEARTRLFEGPRLKIPAKESEMPALRGSETHGEGQARADSRQLELPEEVTVQKSETSHVSLKTDIDAPQPSGTASFDCRTDTPKASTSAKMNIRSKITPPNRDRVGWDSPMACLAQSPIFERFISLVIVFNVVCLGISADLELSDVQRGDFDKSHAHLVFLEKVFVAVYVVELIIRLTVFGKDFFCDEDERYWNAFDTILVLQSIFEQASAALNGTAVMNLSFLRAMRLLKVVKMLRVIRMMRSMKELRLILTAIIGSVRSMLWSLVLLMTCLFMFALIFAQGLAAHIRDANEVGDVSLDEDAMAYWDSVVTAMSTLFKSSTGGIDWNVALPAVSDAGITFTAIFFMYIAFFMFVILNTVTSLFVEATIASAGRDISSNIQNELEKKEEYVKSLFALFQTMDTSGDGEVSLEEFMHEVSNPKLLAFFSSLDIPISDAEIFFKVLSNDGTTTVNLNQFVTSCIRMRGNAQAIDLQDLVFKQTAALREIRKTRKDVQLAKSSLLDVLRARVNNATPQLPAGSIERGTASVPVRGASNWRAKNLPSIHDQTCAPALAAEESRLAGGDAWNPELWACL